jgi:ATP-dependent Clp protease ATP-binding subunit ClpA
MFERFTPDARAAVVATQQQARTHGHNEILAQHLLLGVLEVGGVGARVLRRLGVKPEAVVADVAALGRTDADALGSIGVDLDEVRRRAEAAFGPGALDHPHRRRRGLRSRLLGEHIPFAGEAKKALEDSLRAAQSLRHSYIGTEHIVLGLLADVHGPVAGTLARLGVTHDVDTVRHLVSEELKRTA